MSFSSLRIDQVAFYFILSLESPFFVLHDFNKMKLITVKYVCGIWKKKSEMGRTDKPSHVYEKLGTLSQP